MPNCIVAGCTSKKSKHNNLEGIILHVFPPNIDRIKMWLMQTGQDFGDLDEFAQKVLDGKRTDSYRLCSVHFTPECYIDRNAKKALKFDAVPTIFHKNIASGLKRYRPGTYRTRDASAQTDASFVMKTMKKSPLWKERSHFVTDPHRIDEIRGKFTERVLDLAMEIICLLTREDNTVGKKTSGEHVTPDSHPQMSEGCTTTQSPDMETPPPSLTPETNYKKILEVTNKINELLMGEVPITLQDVIVYFSMEDSEYIEGPEDVITEDPKKQGAVCEVEVEVNDEQDESCVKGDETRIDMDIPPEINTDPENSKSTQSYIEVKMEEGHVRIKEEEIPVEISPDNEDITDTQIDIKVEKEEEAHVKIKKEDFPAEISTGEKYDNMEINSLGLYTRRIDDDMTDNSSDEGSNNPKSNPAPPSTHLSHDPPTDETRVSDHSLPISSHGNGKEEEEVPSTENGRAPHTCPWCEKTFFDQSALRQHEKTHRTEKRYYCQECGKNYLYKSRYMSHRRIHAGERPYCCTKCGKSYANTPDLARHLRTHTEEKPFACPDCGKHFLQKLHLENHQKTHRLQKL